MADEFGDTLTYDPPPQGASSTDESGVVGAFPETPIEAHPNDPWKAFKAQAAQPKAPDQWAAFRATPKQQSNLPPDQLGVGERMLAGVNDPLVGGRQAYQHVFGSNEDVAATDKSVREREADLRARGAGDGDLARSAGRVIPGLVLGAASAGVGGIAGAAAGGAASELLNPVTGKDYAEEKLNQGLMGAAFGAGGGLILKGAGGIVGPTVREAAAEMMKNGVPLTPGQIAGGILRRAEEAAKSFPVIGSFIRGAEGRSIEGFNAATINQALEPIGQKLPKGVVAGHDAITFAKDKLSDAYDTLLPKMHLTMDQGLASDISNARYMASSALPETQFKQLETIIKQRVERHFNNTGSIPGDGLKEIERDLNSLASSYRSSSDGAQRELANSLDDIRGSVRDALTRQNPKQADELAKINEAYAMFTRVEGAAARRAGSQGVFTPSDLLQSIKAGDKTVRKGAFARGDALMQDFAEFANTVLPSKMPDSGTVERGMWDYLMAHGAMPAVAGGAFFAPKTAAIVGTGLLPYTTIGGKIVNAVATPGPVRQAAGAAINAVTAPGGTALEPFLHAGALDYMTDQATVRK